MYEILYTKQAAKNLEKIKANGLAEKAKSLVFVVKENPFGTPPPYEKLVGNLQGYYSRRINIQHRLVYQVIQEPHTSAKGSFDGHVKIIRMWTHYE